MINALTRATKLSAWLALAALISTAPAMSHAPTQAQRDAIKSQCRNDYIAHCSSVPPGGEASLQCLQKNMASLGPGCASAVKAVEAPAAAPAAAKTDAAPATTRGQARGDSGTESRRRRKAEQRADLGDPQRVPLRLSQGLRRCRRLAARPHCNAWRRTRRSSHRPARRRWRPPAAVAPQPAADAAAPAARRAGAAPAVIVLRPLRPREELFVLRSACGGDVRSICGGVQPGGGRIVQCLATNAGSLSPACREVLAPFAAR